MKDKIVHTTIGVYLNGSYVCNGVKPEHLNDHILFNKMYRPGRALFVDGHCIHKGYLTEDYIERFQKKIIEDNILSVNYSDEYL